MSTVFDKMSHLPVKQTPQILQHIEGKLQWYGTIKLILKVFQNHHYH